MAALEAERMVVAHEVMVVWEVVKLVVVWLAVAQMAAAALETEQMVGV